MFFVVVIIFTVIIVIVVQVIEMCWSEHLYDAMIHMYNNGLFDYTTPLLVSDTPTDTPL